MATLKLVTCFICGRGGGGGGVVLPKSRKRKNVNNFVSLNETHVILLKLLLKKVSSGRDSLRHASSIFHDDLLVELQQVGTMISPNPIQLCGRCDLLARNVRELYLELEVVQMKIVEELKRTRELVVGRDLETMDDGIASATETAGQKNRGFRNIIGRFRTSVMENDVNAERIPLVYLGSRLPRFIPEQQMNLQQGVTETSGEDSASTIKQEVPEVDHNADDTYDSEEMFYKNDDCNVKLETPKERVGKGSGRKRRRLPRIPPIKRESPQDPNPRQRNAALRASTLIKITTALASRAPKPPKIQTEAQHLAQKIQAEAKKIRLEKLKLGILKPRAGRKRTAEIQKQCCESCGFEVVSLHAFEQHLRSHEDADKEKPFECPDCKTRFVQKQYFEYHLVLHTNIRRVKCDICEELVFPVDIKEHHLTRHGKAYPCKHCTHCFGSVISLAVHCHHHASPKLTCEECSPPKVIKGSKPFLRHLAQVHDHKDLLISCEFPNCSEKYLLAEKLVHLATHNRAFVCEHCGKNFASKSQCASHIAQVHDKDMRTEVCDLCGKKFLQKVNLESHKVSQHNFPSQFKCEQCPGKIFTAKLCLKIHIVRFHTPMSEWPNTCTIDGCQRRFVTKTELTNHLQHHGTERPFKCDVCGLCLKTKKSLGNHIQVHADVRKHACPECGKRFRWKSHLADHLRSHTGERPYLCVVCGASFTQRAQHNQHKKTHMSDDSSVPPPPQTKNISGESGSSLIPSKEMHEEQEILQQ